MKILIIGIGPGDPDQITLAAIKALNQVDLFLVAEKRAATAELVALRAEICQRFIEHDHYRLIEVPDPERGPDRDRDTAAYRQGVTDWHALRAQNYSRLIQSEIAAGRLSGDAVVGFLVWGDPALYDSTIRIAELIMEQTADPIELRVIPGISSVQLLASAHRIVLNRVGQPIHITTGRRLLGEYRRELGDVVVMLDGSLACAALDHDLQIFWGACLGTADQVIRSGRLGDLIGEISTLRAELRDRKGWVMDTYLLRPPPADQESSSRSPSTSR